MNAAMLQELAEIARRIRECEHRLGAPSLERPKGEDALRILRSALQVCESGQWDDGLRRAVAADARRLLRSLAEEM